MRTAPLMGSFTLLIAIALHFYASYHRETDYLAARNIVSVDLSLRDGRVLTIEDRSTLKVIENELRRVRCARHYPYNSLDGITVNATLKLDDGSEKVVLFNKIEWDDLCYTPERLVELLETKGVHFRY